MNEPNEHRTVVHGPLGTVVDLRVREANSKGEQVKSWVLHELARLESIFSVYDATSELCRWRRGEAVEASPEFCDLMELVLHWQERTNGLFNPCLEALTHAWREAEHTGVPPDACRLATIAAEIQSPRFQFVHGTPTPIADCSTLSLNAIAKGFIVDQTAEAATQRFHLGSITLNIGGDIRHIGTNHVRIGVENPHRPYDNEPALTTIELSDGAFATSGSARRGFTIDGRRYSHVLDPRTGQPAVGIASVSVIAPLATTADVLATAAAVLGPHDAISWLADIDDVYGFVVSSDGDRFATPSWIDRFGSITPA